MCKCVLCVHILSERPLSFRGEHNMFYVFLIKSSFQAFPGSPVVEPMPPMLGVWVPSLVWELRSHMPHRVDKKLKKKKKSSRLHLGLFNDYIFSTANEMLFCFSRRLYFIPDILPFWLVTAALGSAV